MSSGTHAVVADVRQNFGGIANLAAGGAVPSGEPELTQRQKELTHLWNWYKTRNYDSRGTDWNGNRAYAVLDKEAIASGIVVPPGFYDASGATLPVAFRRPTAPHQLCLAVVNRFTSLLFSAKRHPKIVCTDDKKTTEWLEGFAEATRLWSRMALARTYGGAMKSSAISLKFVNGKPRLEVHDPRWCVPYFASRDDTELMAFEKRYPYMDTVLNPRTGVPVTGWFWYRRVIDTDSDTVWEGVPVLEGDEPDWGTASSKRQVFHGLGFAPVVWIQNVENQEDIDGEPDCLGAFPSIETIDGLYAQCNKGCIHNADPTLHVGTDAESPDSLLTGSDNAITTEKGGTASYMEITGSGIKVSLELAKQLEANVLRTVRCVLDDNFHGPARTEEETQQNYASMLERVDLFREQYGELGVKRILEMALKAARVLGEERTVPDPTTGAPTLVRGVVVLPRNKDGSERVIGNGECLELKWPDFAVPSVGTVLSAVQASTQALAGGLVDPETATRFVAQYFEIEDIGVVVAKVKAAADAAAEAFTAANAPEEEAAPAEEDTGDNDEDALSGLDDAIGALDEAAE